MHSNLVGQYVVDGWDEKLYHTIVAVTQDREKVFVFAKNLDDHIVQYDLENCIVVRKTPYQKELEKQRDKLAKETNINYQSKIKTGIAELEAEAERTTSE